MSYPYRSDLFLRACRGERTPTIPVWLMRQAGRYMAEYRAIRSRLPILEMMKDPVVATEVTLQPVEAFPLDAAIIFADILTLLEPMGLRLEFVPGKGPLLENPVRTATDVSSLRSIDAPRDLDYTLEAIRLTRARLAGRIPLIGFSGAPFTLACYAIEGSGSKDFDGVRAWMHADRRRWAALMDRLTEAVSDYLHAQIDAGAQALQLFDSWAGCLSADDYVHFAAPWTRRVLESLGSRVPRIHFSANGGHLLEVIGDLPVEVIGLDWRIAPADAIRRLGHQRVFQGNLDPAVLLSDTAVIREEARKVCTGFRPARAHIFNLGHGVIKTTPTERVRELVDWVHSL